MIVRSPEAETSRRPSVEYITELTRSEWLSSVLCRTPVAVSQSRMVRSLDADASHRPSGENVVELTKPEWPLSVLRGTRVVVSQSQTQCPIADASHCPS